MDALADWWRALTDRERSLLRFAGILLFGVLLPAWAYLAASGFRDEAAARLASARQIEAQVARIVDASRRQAAAPQGEDGSARARAVAAAQAAGLVPARIEAIGADGVRIAFEPADSLVVYRWMGMVGVSGAFVVRSSIVRIADSDLVHSEFDVTEAP
jgi:type II secretory pathway component PulM